MGSSIGSVELNSIGGINAVINFYYSGTAPSPVLLSFKTYPHIDNASGYIDSPCNEYASSLPTGEHYNTITIECTKKKEFRITTPNILTSYN